MKDTKWKLERDFHMAMFNLVNWVVLWQSSHYIREINRLKDVRNSGGANQDNEQPQEEEKKAEAKSPGKPKRD
jgi:hypothetical protein